MEQVPLNLTWTPLQVKGWSLERRLLAVQNLRAALAHWDQTAYESGQCFAGRGADCIGAVFGVVDELDGLARRMVAGLPNDVSMHCRETAVAAMRELIRRYAPCQKVKARDGVLAVQPGDILITGIVGGGPGHVSMIGCDPNTLWEATPSSGFQRKGWSLLREQRVWAVYRLMNKELWLEAK